MTFITFISPRTAMALATAALVAACASTPLPNARLEDARAAYQATSTNAMVVRAAPVELQQAREALTRAENAFKAGEDSAAVNHYAYVARQRTELALMAGKIAQSDAEVAQASVQRDRMVIETRTMEAEKARTQADKARAAAEAARVQAEQEKSAAMQAKTSAEKARADADAARKLAEERLAAAQTARQQAAAAQSQVGSLEAQLAELKAKKTDRGMVLTLGDVLFDTGKATLKAGAMRTVDQLAQFLEKNPERKIVVEGHTDNVGSDAYNLSLSERRAEAVRQALTERRIATDRVVTAGLGEGYPVANNSTAAGRQQNRRVEVIFSDDAGNVKARTN